MKKISQKAFGKFADSRGFSLVEMVVVVLILGILAAVSIPQLISMRRLMKFSGMQQHFIASLRDARELAMSKRRQIVLRYDNNTKQVITYEPPTVPVLVDTIGPLGDSRNTVVTLTDNGLSTSDIVYGAPGGAPTTLPDTSTLTPLVSGVVDVTFSPRGDAIDSTGAPLNNALFFYENNSQTAFAVSVLGPGGRIKTWSYNGSIYQ